MLQVQQLVVRHTPHDTQEASEDDSTATAGWG